MYTDKKDRNMLENMSLRDKKEGLKKEISQILQAEGAIATALLGIGVGISWDENGDQRFEVRLFSDPLQQAQVDKLRISDLPQTFHGLAVNYEIIKQIEFLSDIPENEWWQELPEDEEVRVLIQAKVSRPAQHPQSLEEKRTQSLARYTAAVEAVIEFMKSEEIFTVSHFESLRKMEALGYVALSGQRIHFERLMKSGLVESIFPDFPFSG